MAGTAMAIMLLGAIEAHRLHGAVETEPIVPVSSRNLQGATAWQILYRSRSDRAYITVTTMGQ
jgi:hypothetical protein